MRIIDGKATAAAVKHQIKQQIAEIAQKYNKTVGLAVILVGNNAASSVYVRNKINDCKEVGVNSVHIALDASVDEATLIGHIERLNEDENINGILVQLPLPAHINESAVLAKILPQKDVDGFSAHQMGRLALGKPALAACTPSGVMELLKQYNISPKGKNAVVIGRSNIVGKPMALLLLAADATVTICHSKTPDIASITKKADIIVAAVGRAHFVTADMVKEGAVVIDVGINRLPNGSLTGDVDFEAVADKVSYITPVPGGVGPMTRAMLLVNTVRAFLEQNE